MLRLSIRGSSSLDWATPIALVAAATHELTLFAAVGLLVGGIDDLVVDGIFAWQWFRERSNAAPTLADLPPPARRFAIFVPAWDESAVIGAMLTTLVARLPEPSLTVFVGTYPNDPDTIEAVARVAERDPRIRLAIGSRAGPTTKADCLNRLWHAMLDEEAWRGGEAYDAVILHDAEDVVHPGELAVFDHFLADADAVQLPVMPLPRPGRHLVGGTYLDEFAEAHGRTLVVRGAIGAGLPLAGVGCAVSRTMLASIAATRDGSPFDASSLTEDYELGLTIAAIGGRARFAVVREPAGGLPVAVHAYFPDTFETAVRQKTRWTLGIALAGWDRTGWGRSRNPGEWWMRMRDRRALLSMAVLTASYGALLLWLAHPVFNLNGTADGWLDGLLVITGMLLVWRAVVRATFVTRRYGVIEGLWSLPRMIVGNFIALIAAKRALERYLRMLRGAPARWDKTAHQFPDLAAGG